MELVIGCLSEYSDEIVDSEECSEEVLKIRVTNIGGQPVILNANTFYFMMLGNSVKLDQNRIDWFGLQKLSSPLNPGTSCEVAVITDGLLDELGCDDLRQYCNPNDYKKTRVPIEAGVKDISDISFKSLGFSYFYYVNSLERIT